MPNYGLQPQLVYGASGAAAIRQDTYFSRTAQVVSEGLDTLVERTHDLGGRLLGLPGLLVTYGIQQRALIMYKGDKGKGSQGQGPGGHALKSGGRQAGGGKKNRDARKQAEKDSKKAARQADMNNPGGRSGYATRHPHKQPRKVSTDPVPNYRAPVHPIIDAGSMGFGFRSGSMFGGDSYRRTPSYQSSPGPVMTPGTSGKRHEANPLSNAQGYRYVGGGLIECPDGIHRTEKEAKKYAAGKKERDRLKDRLNRVF